MNKIVLVFLGIMAIQAQENKPSGVVNLRPQWQQIGPGFSRDEAQKLLGEGVFRDTLGDCGAAYYTDPSHSVTLSIFYYTDCYCWDFTVRSGYFPPPHMSLSETGKIASATIKPNVGFGYGGSVHFGDSMDVVERNLGSPKLVWKDQSLLFWTYDCVADTERTGIAFGFLKRRLEEVRFFLGGD